ncbi:hypothetical protein BTVI_19725 [Pitangus sulphuratus]|nr:hypothetical protein BTVI_19725 [Pitangus sulphuratus]
MCKWILSEVNGVHMVVEDDVDVLQYKDISGRKQLKNNTSQKKVQDHLRLTAKGVTLIVAGLMVGTTMQRISCPRDVYWKSLSGATVQDNNKNGGASSSECPIKTMRRRQFPKPENYLDKFTAMYSKVEKQNVLLWVTVKGEGVMRDWTTRGSDQHGSMKDGSYLTNLIFSDQVTPVVDGGKAVDVVYLDFSKAFDTVSHSILLMKFMSAKELDGLVKGDNRITESQNTLSWKGLTRIIMTISWPWT